jgi:hypothetical protein
MDYCDRRKEECIQNFDDEPVLKTRFRKSIVFWDVTPFISVEVSRRFGRVDE